MSKLISFISLIILFSNCNTKDAAINRIETQFKSSLATITKNQDVASEIYMVIPRAGCSTCISTAEGYMIGALKDSLRAPYIRFILTDFDSEKILRARYGTSLKSKNIIIDRNNVFKSNESLKSLYPVIYFFDKDSRLSNISEVSPEVNGLAEIDNYLNNRKL